MATDFSGLEGEALVNAWFGYFDSIAEPADDKVHQWESRIRYRRYKIAFRPLCLIRETCQRRRAMTWRRTTPSNSESGSIRA
jgi:hypothetical protein